MFDGDAGFQSCDGHPNRSVLPPVTSTLPPSLPHLCYCLSYSPTGEVVWIREEALASVVAVEMLDLPATSATGSAETVYSLLHSQENPLLMAALRLRMQISTASQLLQSLLERGLSALVHESSHKEMLRDQFNIRKMIVVATTAGKVREQHSVVYECVSQE